MKPSGQGWRWLLAGLLTLFFSTLGHAQVIRLDQMPGGPLGARALYLQERGAELTLAQARAALQHGEFHRDERPIASFGLGARPVWVYLELQNPLEAALALRLIAGMGWIDRLDVIQLKGEQVLASWQSGDEAGPVDGADNLVPGLGFAFPLAVPAGRSEIFIRAQSADPLLLPLSLQLMDDAAATERAVHYGYGLLYGVLLALLLVGGLGGGLHYGVCLLCFTGLNLAWTGHGYAWWWPDDARFERYAMPALMVMLGASGFNFADHFLALRARGPRLRRWLRASAAAALLGMATCALLDAHAPAVWLAAGFALWCWLAMGLLGLWALRKRLPAARSFLAAIGCALGGTAFSALAVLGMMPLGPLSLHGVEIGAVLGALLLLLSTRACYAAGARVA